MPDLSQWTAGLFVPSQRSIGGIHAQVTISEQERDELTITEHPVEQGAPISDHAFKRPSEVTIRAGWSAQSAGDLGANGNGVYGILLSWQAALRPFVLYTGKRTYQDMLIQSLTVVTDERSEFALMADIVCKQVIIVSTSTKQVSQPNAASDNPGNMDNPGDNAPPKDNGAMQTDDVSFPAIQDRTNQILASNTLTENLQAKNIEIPASQFYPQTPLPGGGTEAPLPPPIP